MKVLGKSFSLEFIDASRLDAGCTYGTCSPHDQLILIQAGLTQDKEREVKIHELLHAIHDGMDVGYSEATEEKFVSAYAKGLAAFIADNDEATINRIFGFVSLD